MKTSIKKFFFMAIVMVMLFHTQACTKDDKEISKNKKNSNSEEIEADITTETALDMEAFFDSSKDITENMDLINNTLEKNFGRSFQISSVEDYEKGEQADWILLLGENKVGIDTSRWKYNYEENSDEEKFMDAILELCIFFYGEEMGNSLWLLTGDLIDDGTDESIYGFKHVGGKAIYKNGNSATYEWSEANENFYLWLTPYESESIDNEEN